MKSIVLAAVGCLLLSDIAIAASSDQVSANWNILRWFIDVVYPAYYD